MPSLLDPPRQNPPWWRSVKNEAVLRQLVNVLAALSWNTLEGGVLDSFRRPGTDRVASWTASKANNMSS